MRALMVDLGLTAEQAAGVVGNLGYESGGFAKLQELKPLAGGRGGYGWPQWTGPRRQAFEHWCADHDLNPSSDVANYHYLLVELTGAYAHTIEQLKKTTTLDAAVFTFGEFFERPAGTTATNLPGDADRLRWAKRALAGATQEEKPMSDPQRAPTSAAPPHLAVTAGAAVGLGSAASDVLLFMLDKIPFFANMPPGTQGSTVVLATAGFGWLIHRWFR